MEALVGSLFALAILAGLIFAGVTAARALSGGKASGGEEGSEPLDIAEVAKSLAVHLGLFLALIACAVGLIDLLQSLVQDQQLAGSSSDLARGLSLLIVGAPAFALLLRVVGRRYLERGAEGDIRPHRGWSVYLVVALTVTLIATLTSVAQITNSVTDRFDDFEPNELMQLLVWAAAWLGHWFVLRPKYGVRGDAHLAIGSIIGLAWMLSGAGAVIYRVLTEAYDSAFNDTLAGSFDVAMWLVVMLVGAVVWAWHWLAHFNASGSVEGDRRKSPLWFFTIVVAGVLPGLITILFSVTAMVSGLAIWFVGSTERSAADYFDAGPGLMAALFIGLVTWAYHLWELERGGVPARNESLRFNDYVVVAVGLSGTVASIAAIIALFIDAISVRRGLAGSLDIGNSLIVAVTVLIAAAALWWSQWSRVERHRSEDVFAESDSIWRKLYLIVAFGLGGLVLAVSLIWLLFVFLRDLLDGQLGDRTLDDLTGPIGWGIAVVGAVWYHLGVWRVDRVALAAHTPVVPVAPGVVRAEASSPPQLPALAAVRAEASSPPQLPAPGVVRAEASSPPQLPAPAVGVVDATIALRSAVPDDYGELFTLQRAAFVDEAVTYETVEVPTLQETFAELRRRLDTSATIVAVDGARIVGSVSLRRWREGGADIERLMIAPDRRRSGLATMLLDEVERNLEAQGETSVQLIVGEIVTDARSLYDGRGYELVSREQAVGGPALLTVRKTL